jgi:hypothetical protein
MAEYARIFSPRPLHEAGPSGQVDMDVSLSERAARVLEKLPADQRPRFQSDVAQYATWDQLPQALRDLILRYEAV